MFTKLAQVMLVSVIGLFALVNLWSFSIAMYQNNLGEIGSSFTFAIGAIILDLFLIGRFFDKKKDDKDKV